MARTVKKVNDNYFSQTESCIQRIHTALEICKQSLVFTLTVENDYENIKSYKNTFEVIIESGSDM